MTDATAARTDSRESILARVRKSIEEGRRAGRLPQAPPPGTAPVPPPIPEDVVRQMTTSARDEWWAQYVRCIEALGDQGHRVADRAEARNRIEAFVRELGLKRGVADPDAVAWLGIADGKLGGAEVATAGDRNTAFEADFGITLCAAAVGETGTLVLRCGQRRALLTSLAPPVHFALVPWSLLVADLADLRTVAGIAESSHAVWITGSSRTADIEGILIRGVHGPGKLIAIGVENA